jgi:hypothetical protein
MFGEVLKRRKGSWQKRRKLEWLSSVPAVGQVLSPMLSREARK